MTKTAEKHTLWGRTYLYSPYKGVPPPPLGVRLTPTINPFGASRIAGSDFRKEKTTVSSSLAIYSTDYVSSTELIALCN